MRVRKGSHDCRGGARGKIDVRSHTIAVSFARLVLENHDGTNMRYGTDARPLVLTALHVLEYTVAIWFCCSLRFFPSRWHVLAQHCSRNRCEPQLDLLR